MTISNLPPAPNRTEPETFSDKADTFVAALPTFVTEANALAAEVEANKTLAVNSASAALNSENSASLSANESQASATAAAASESAAATSETNAANSATAAASAYDSFDDRYLGSKTSDPILDNDGDALITGALYFNTTDDVMKVYDGAAWVAAYVSLGDALLGFNNLSDVNSAETARTNLGLGTGDSPSFVDLTIADKIIHAGDTNTAIRFPAADTVTVETGGTERMRIDSSGNVLVGTTNANSPVQVGIKSGTGWTYRTYAFTSGNSRTVTFSADFNYQVEVTYTATPNSGAIAQSRFIAGRRDYAGASHCHAVGDIIGTAADIAVSTSDSGNTRTYTLTLDHGTDGSNLHHMIEVKTREIDTLSVS
jgi:hypothetical protein